MSAATSKLIELSEQAVAHAQVFEDAMGSIQPGTPSGYEIAEDHWGICPCDVPPEDKFEAAVRAGREGPDPSCRHCQGQGYRLTKRIIRPIPKPDPNEQVLLAEIKTLEAKLKKAANTLEADSVRLLEPDQARRTRYSQEAKAAARAIRGEAD